MRIGFFGGSFDPPHLGHLAVARAAAEAFSLDRILFAPTAHQPLKPGGAHASYQDRLAMVSLLCALQTTDVPSFESSSIDAPLPGSTPNYTVDTLTRLRRIIGTTDSIFSIVGADAFLDLPRWRSPLALLEISEWIVVSRPGFVSQQLDAVPLNAEQRQRVHRLDNIEEPASASRIRELLRGGAACEGLLPPSILAYIRARHLYET